MAENWAVPWQLRFRDRRHGCRYRSVPFARRPFGVFPHLLDRYKPGIIGVLRSGQRFTNESNSYHDVGAAMIRRLRGRAGDGDVADLR